MIEQLTITERDIRLLLDVVDAGQGQTGEEAFPHDLMRRLADLVPADDITFQVSRPVERTIVSLDEAFPVPETGGADDFFWQVYWGSICSRPQRTGDYDSVFMQTDGHPTDDHRRGMVDDWMRMAGITSEIVVPFPPDGAEDRRLLLFRLGGPGFTERERLLLTLLQPALRDIRARVARSRAGTPDLTPRQWELLRLVADGASNAQIARRMRVAEGTVRKHLENIYARLGVPSRTAAVTAAFPRQDAWPAAG